MNSIERIAAALSFATPDQTPVMPQIFAHTALVSGHGILDYVTNGLLAADCQLNALARYGHDNVFAVMDVCVEAEAVGARLRLRPGLYPAVVEHPLLPTSNLLALEVPDPRHAARMPELLAMARKLRDSVGDKTLVVGMVQGPMTLAMQFLGPEAALFMAADQPERFEQVLDFGAEVAIRFGLAQMEAGVHLPLVFEPAGCPEIVPAGFFREFLAPRLAKIFAAFKAAGALTNWLHIAGQTSSILPLYQEIGVGLANFDYCIDPLRLRALLPGAPCVDGNIKPVAFIENSPEEIELEARRLVNGFARRGGFILSSGCEIPPESKPENVAALIRAAHEESCARISPMPGE